MISQTFKNPHPAGVDDTSIEWFVLDGDTPEDLEWLDSLTDLSPDIAGLLKATPLHNERLHPESAVLLRMVRNDTEAYDALVGFNIFIQPTRMITVCFGVTPDVEALLQKYQGTNLPGSAFRLLPLLITAFIKPLESELTELADQIDELEVKAMEDKHYEGDDDVVTVGRKALGLRRYLSPITAELTFLSLNPEELPGAADAKYLRREAEYVGRMLGAIDTIHHRVSLLLNYLRNRDEERLGRSMHKLTLVATVFLPLTFVTGLLGINVAGVPDAHNPYAFWRVCFFLLLLAVLAVAVIRWKKWM